MTIGKHEFLRRGTVNAALPGPWRSSNFTRVNPLAVKLILLYRARKQMGRAITMISFAAGVTSAGSELAQLERHELPSH